MSELNWLLMSKEERQAFIKESIERHHKQRYMDALEFHGTVGPAWEDLTDEQRENIRQENRRYDREMQEFGESLRSQ